MGDPVPLGGKGLAESIMAGDFAAMFPDQPAPETSQESAQLEVSIPKPMGLYLRFGYGRGL